MNTNNKEVTDKLTFITAEESSVNVFQQVQVQCVWFSEI